MHRIPDTEFIKTPTYKVLTLTRKSRPTTRFVNVGSAFMNARELAKRKVVSQHKSRLRARRNLEKKKIMFSPDYFYLSQRKSRIRARRKLKKPPKE